MLQVNTNFKTANTVSEKANENKTSRTKAKSEEQKEAAPSVILDISVAKEAEKDKINQQVQYLYEMQKENEKSIFQKSTKTSKAAKSSNGMSPEEVNAATKKTMFESLVKRARLLMPHQYTMKSWKSFTRLMKDALKLSAKQKDGLPDALALDRAIKLMQSGMAGLEMEKPSEADGKMRDMLPTEEEKHATSEAQKAAETAANSAATPSASAAAEAALATLSASIDVEV